MSLTLMAAVVVCGAAGCGRESGRGAAASVSAQTNSQAAEPAIDEALLTIVAPADMDNVVVEYSAYTALFNPSLHVPNATIYVLTAAHTDGSVPRSNNFHRDKNVAGCADTRDYTRSGYSRGHMVPAGDMKWDETAMSESFSMVNVCPQNADFNSGAWNDLEQDVRQWARRYGTLIVATGPIFNAADKGTIGKETQVAVPSALYKIIYCPAKREMIAFVMPNEANVSHRLADWCVAVDDVERATGLDFFSALDDEEESALEANSNIANWKTR